MNKCCLGQILADVLADVPLGHVVADAEIIGLILRMKCGKYP